MKIRISILHRDDESLISDEYEMDSAEYDALSYPEDMLHAKIWELRNKVTNELIRRHRSNIPHPLIDPTKSKVGAAFFDENGMISRVIVQPSQTIDSGSNTVQNTEE